MREETGSERCAKAQTVRAGRWTTGVLFLLLMASLAPAADPVLVVGVTEESTESWVFQTATGRIEIGMTGGTGGPTCIEFDLKVFHPAEELRFSKTLKCCGGGTPCFTSHEIPEIPLPQLGIEFWGSDPAQGGSMEFAVLFHDSQPLAPQATPGSLQFTEIGVGQTVQIDLPSFDIHAAGYEETPGIIWEVQSSPSWVTVIDAAGSSGETFCASINELRNGFGGIDVGMRLSTSAQLLKRAGLATSITIPVSAAPSSDFAIRVEERSRKGTTHHTVVVGSWTVDGIQGWSWSLKHDPEEARIGDCAGHCSTCVAGNPSNACEIEGPDRCDYYSCPPDMAAPGPEGQKPFFHSVNVYDYGINQGVVLDSLQKWDLDATERFELLYITYECLASRAELEFCHCVGKVPVETTFVIAGNSYYPPFPPPFILQCEPSSFVRGDANCDGKKLDMSDAVFILQYLFGDGPTPLCLDAADANDDGRIELSDPVYSLQYLFNNGSAPPPPSPDRGTDPTNDSLGCVFYPPAG